MPVESLLLSEAGRSVDFKCDEGFDPAPYSHLYSSIRITVELEPNRFDRFQQDLQIADPFQSLKNFSDNLPDGSEYNVAMCNAYGTC